MDDHPGHLVYIPLLEFFRCRCCHNSSSRAVPPARAVKAALAEALVWYYPVAGRLREIAGGKLVVDCTAEGVAFVEADADVRLEELGEPLLPPFPCVEVLLCDAGDIGVVVGKPIVFLQVTEFKCGGFVMGFYISHCIADGFGMIQFIKAIVDIARGEQAPMVLPVWERHILTSRSPPPTIGATNTNTVKFSSVLKDSTSIDDDIMLSTPQESMVGNYFLFRPNHISALRSHVHEHGATTATRFELITAVIWRCRTVALGYKTDHRVHLLFAANSRRHRGDGTLRIPEGYYGNALTYHVAAATAGELCGTTLARTVALIREAKLDGTTEERVRSTVAFLASLRLRRSGGRFPALAFDKAYAVSDFTRLGEDGLDFGWAERVGGGVATPSFVSFHSRWKLVSSDGDGEEEEAVAALMLLPKPAMDRFDKELALWLDLDKPSVGGLCLSSKF
uniref:Hsr201 hypersensitivity-related protein n=5 Tax=Oryza sativa subsp. japonica TaxID=39947 RepID=A0A5S6RD39_ORYSJ|nr:Putative hsr201 hypersensitivity-related protein [Oryza sativa Japonica Group]AAP51791.1 Transferase family protein, expressed [Oryza sativa Japonica Group]